MNQLTNKIKWRKKLNTQIIIVLFLNSIVSIIGTLAYSVRLVGVRTGKIAITYSVFNILTLISRIAVTFQAPMLTKFVENNSSSNNSIDKSIPKLMIHSFSKTGISYMRECIAIPTKTNITKVNYKKLPIKIIIFNLITVSLITVGSLAPIYAGNIAPDLRATCVTLSSIINGIATVLMSIFIDPQLSIMTDEVIDGKCTEEDFRTCVVAMVGSKSIGTFASILLLIPASYLIVFFAKVI